MVNRTRNIDLDRVRQSKLADRLRTLLFDPPEVLAAAEIRRYLDALTHRRLRVDVDTIVDECIGAATTLTECGHHKTARDLLGQAAQRLMLRGHFRAADRLHQAFHRAQREP